MSLNIFWFLPTHGDGHYLGTDEWHELMGNKRGVQTQLALARLRMWNPCLLYTSPSPRDRTRSRMPSSA